MPHIFLIAGEGFSLPVFPSSFVPLKKGSSLDFLLELGPLFGFSLFSEASCPEF